MIRHCAAAECDSILTVINDAAQAYKGFIPDDCWHEPYMSREKLLLEIADGIEFWGYEEEGELLGVMGIQDRREVTLIRHAYVKTVRRHGGIGTRLLRYLEGLTDKPILIGTWLAATWAIAFYEKNGYRSLSREETNFLLGKFWTLSDLQLRTSIVLANGKWVSAGPTDIAP